MHQNDAQWTHGSMEYRLQWIFGRNDIRNERGLTEKKITALSHCVGDENKKY